MYTSSERYSTESLWFPIVYPYKRCIHHSSLMISILYHDDSYYAMSLTIWPYLTFT